MEANLALALEQSLGFAEAAAELRAGGGGSRGTQVEALIEALGESGTLARLQNTIVALADGAREKAPAASPDCLQAVGQWQEMVLDRLAGIFQDRIAALERAQAALALQKPEEPRVAASAPGSDSDSDAGMQSPTDLAGIELAGLQFVYDSVDLFQFLAGLTPAVDGPGRVPAVASLQLETEAPSLAQLRNRYPDLHPAHRHLGLDENRLWIERQTALAAAVAGEGSSLAARLICRTGAPASLRGPLWRLAMGLAPAASGAEEAAYAEACAKVAKDSARIPVDSLLHLDVDNTLGDEHYFVFGPQLEDALRLLFRDASLAAELRSSPLTASLVFESGPSDIPPAGIIPYQGMSLYAGPLYYCYSSPAEASQMFRAMYSRYWARLCSLYWNGAGSHSSTILGLANLFESTLRAVNPAVFGHVLGSTGSSPLRIAFPWLMYGFVGYLEISQVLILWDRVIGYDSLELLPLTAAAIFHFRGPSLLAATTPEAVEDVFLQSSTLEVLPLLQGVLFAPELVVAPARAPEPEPGPARAQKSSRRLGSARNGSGAPRGRR